MGCLEKALFCNKIDRTKLHRVKEFTPSRRHNYNVILYFTEKE